MNVHFFAGRGSWPTWCRKLDNHQASRLVALASFLSVLGYEDDVTVPSSFHCDFPDTMIFNLELKAKWALFFFCVTFGQGVLLYQQNEIRTEAILIVTVFREILSSWILIWSSNCQHEQRQKHRSTLSWAAAEKFPSSFRDIDFAQTVSLALLETKISGWASMKERWSLLKDTFETRILNM